MKRRSVTRALFSAMLLLLPTGLAESTVGPAYAQPGGAAESADTSGVTLTWRALGLEPQIYLSPDTSATSTVPMPDGLTATRFKGMIHTPTNIDAGYLDINDREGKLLATVPLPPPDSPQAVTPIDVDISAARVEASTLDLSMTVRARQAGDRFCGPVQQLMLSDLAITFAGSESPATTIANFFPPVLERVAIYTPTDPDTAEQQSVLTLVSTLTRLYRPQPLAITVVTQPRGAIPPPAGERTRSIVVESGGAAGLRVERPGTPAF